MAWFSDTPKKSIAYGVVAGLAGMALGGWLDRRFRPPVEHEVVKTVNVETKGNTVVKTVEGPVRVRVVTQTKFKDGPVVERLVTREEERDPVVIDRHTETQTDRQAVAVQIDRPLPDPPQWAVGTGLQLRPGRELQLSLERRLAGPFWLTGWVVQPLQISAPTSGGLGLRVEF